MKKLLVILLLLILTGCTKESNVQDYKESMKENIIDFSSSNSIVVNQDVINYLNDIYQNSTFIYNIDFNLNGIELFNYEYENLYSIFIDNNGQMTKKELINIGIHEDVYRFEILHINKEYLVWYQQYNEGNNYITKVYMTWIIKPTIENTKEIYEFVNVVEGTLEPSYGGNPYYKMFGGVGPHKALIAGDYISFNADGMTWLIYDYKNNEYIDTSKDGVEYFYYNQLTGNSENIITAYNIFKSDEDIEVGAVVFDTFSKEIKLIELPFEWIYNDSLKLVGNKLFVEGSKGRTDDDMYYLWEIGYYDFDTSEYTSIYNNTSDKVNGIVMADNNIVITENNAEMILYNTKTLYKTVLDKENNSKICVDNVDDYLVFIHSLELSIEKKIYFYYIGDLTDIN